MKEVFEKNRERLEEQRGHICNCMPCNGCKYIGDCNEGEFAEDVAIDKAIEIVNQVEAEYAPDINVGNNDGWIPVSERLPSHEEAWYYNEDDGIYEPNEFIVMIEGAELPTVLFYDKNYNEWSGVYDDVYEVIAWQPLPAPYKPKGEK